MPAVVSTNSIVESTQLWWSVRPHHSFGTVEVRICDAQTRGDESFNLAALVTACVAQAAIDLDLVVEYGAGIVELARAVRRNVIAAVEQMTGLEVIEVNIAVNDIQLPDQDQQEPSTPRVE